MDINNSERQNSSPSPFVLPGLIPLCNAARSRLVLRTQQSGSATPLAATASQLGRTDRCSLLDDCLKKSTFQRAGIHHHELSIFAPRTLYSNFCELLLLLVLRQAPENEQGHVS